ncbi:hypothetical protein [Halioxenophilus sp. WMMB6]|uniref:hypothetical protein n=1 Tax=Halioxenophilus sp. WMMB6 TaxID=3073815 RepID=UPI00295EBF93|nr:hypothetical protein [Halioxenophilus sp. WMMB6]
MSGFYPEAASCRFAVAKGKNVIFPCSQNPQKKSAGFGGRHPLQIACSRAENCPCVFGISTILGGPMLHSSRQGGIYGVYATEIFRHLDLKEQESIFINTSKSADTLNNTKPR